MWFTEQVTYSHLWANSALIGHLVYVGVIWQFRCQCKSVKLGEDNWSWHKWTLQSFHKGNDPYKTKLMCYTFSYPSDKVMHVMLHCYLLLSPKQFIPVFHHCLV